MSREDFYASPFGVAYSTYMERPRLGRLVGCAAWGGDIKPYYESMSAVAEVTDGGTIIDCPCGAGPALRALHPDAEVRYVAADLSPSNAPASMGRWLSAPGQRSSSAPACACTSASSSSRRGVSSRTSHACLAPAWGTATWSSRPRTAAAASLIRSTSTAHCRRCGGESSGQRQHELCPRPNARWSSWLDSACFAYTLDRVVQQFAREVADVPA